MAGEELMAAALAAVPWAAAALGFAAAAWALSARRAADAAAPDLDRDTLVETAALRAMEDELSTLRAAAGACPWPAWHLGAEGGITWANAAYLALEEAVLGPGRATAWPPALLFAEARGEPAEIVLASGAVRAFDRIDLPTEGGSMRFAAPADRALAAERRGRHISDAYADTLGRLGIGIALFDEGRRLEVFNRVLSDLTGLPASFLEARPSLPTLLGRLREVGGSAAGAAAVEEAAAAGSLRETWTLPSGRAWRVTGMPHAGGAIALLFEDAAREARAALRLRGAMVLGQALVDAMEGAVCVFNGSGALAMANGAYAELWEADPRRLTGDATLADALRRWRGRSLPSGAWDALEAATEPGGGPWESAILLRDGRHLSGTAIPLGDGALLVRFEETGARTRLSVVAAAPAHA